MCLDLGGGQGDAVAEDEGQDGHDEAVEEEVGEETDADGADDEEGARSPGETDWGGFGHGFWGLLVRVGCGGRLDAGEILMHDDVMTAKFVMVRPPSMLYFLRCSGVGYECWQNRSSLVDAL